MNTEKTKKPISDTNKGNDVILRTRGLSKDFGKLRAVDNLNIEIRRGDVFGFLGPNGAGKSTTVGMILNLVSPTSGSVELFGRELTENPWAALRRIGAVIESPAFYPYLSGWDNLEALTRSIGNIPRSKITEVLQRVNLLDRAKDKYGHYSMGMKQRLGIASTLLPDPELIILDEPTNGLDPAGMKEIRDLIPQIAQENGAVMLCSHLLHEVEMVCTRVAIIKQGVTLANSSIKELTNQGQYLKIRVEERIKAKSILSIVPWIKSISEEKGYLVVGAPLDKAAQLNRTLAEQGVFASELVSENSSLENIFLQLTGGKSDD
jgi:ABC-2 type transport system ATP-binding protein